jgi:type II secretory pathway pseudopilin PulG
MDCFEMKRDGAMEQRSEQGFMLVGLIVAIFLILLALSVAAPKVAQNLRREREVEAIHRGNQYVRAIRLYYRKTNTYPATIEQLEKTTNIRYLRQRYVDPITGKDDWRLIHVGEAKTTVKGFFGQPLAGLATGPGAGVGSPIGSNAGATGAAGQTGLTSVFGSPGGGGYGASSPGGGGLGSGGLGSSPGGTGGLGSSSSGTGGGLGGSTLGGNSTLGGTSSGGLGSNSPGSGTTGSGSTIGASAGIGGQSASTFSGSAQPFVGVGVPKEGDSITILNEQTAYNTWEFIYDPRIEQLYAKGALLGGGANALGSSSGSSGGSGSGSSLGGFGNNSGSGTGLGSGGGLGSGSGLGSTSPTTPTSPQQPHY